MAGEMFKGILMASLFYSVAITLFIYALPTDVSTFLDTINFNRELSNSTNFESTLSTLKEQATTDNYALLIFRTGNTVLDLLANFILALPSMVANLLLVITAFSNIDPYIANTFSSTIYLISSIVWLLYMFNKFVEILTGRRPLE